MQDNNNNNAAPWTLPAATAAFAAAGDPVWKPRLADELLQRSRMIGLIAECSAVCVLQSLQTLQMQRGNLLFPINNPLVFGLPVEEVKIVAAVHE